MARAPDIVWTVLVGAGRGDRFGALKQYESLGEERVIDRARRTAERATDGVVVVVPAADVERERGVAGGATRSESVRAGLASVPPEATIVCIHDAARPLASTALFDRVCDAVRDGADGAVPAVPVVDTIKVVDLGGAVTSTLDRSELVAVQTPQAFAADTLRRAHIDGAEASDDAALIERAGGRVVTVPGEPWNRKITDRDDLEWARRAAASVDANGPRA